MATGWLDLILALYLLLHLVTGFQQGFFLSGAGLAAASLALLVGIGLAPLWAAAPPVIATLIFAGGAFFLLKLLQAKLVARLGPALAARPRLQRLDRWLGLLPGLAWGLLGAGLIAWFVSAFAGGLPARAPLSAWLLRVVQAPLTMLGNAVPAEAPEKMGPVPSRERTPH